VGYGLGDGGSDGGFGANIALDMVERGCVGIRVGAEVVGCYFCALCWGMLDGDGTWTSGSCMLTARKRVRV
jgi:hypothetical protein